MIEERPLVERPPDLRAADGVFDPDYYRHERYLRPSQATRLLALFYAVKPRIPRRWQLALRRRYARRQVRRPFPGWPIEPILVEQQHEQLRRALSASGQDRIPLVGFWPRGHSFACVLTHDVEGPEGLRNIPSLLELERRYGFVSSWNFVAEQYEIRPGTFQMLSAAGCEIGLHGIQHDGKLFQSRRHFESNLPKIRHYLNEWGAVGFRSPSTLRRAEWIHELGCLYDSSYPDTDPFQPQPGGCCSIFPFMFGDVVELPITLAQDQTLWEILEHPSIEIWLHKSEWIIRNHGLINLITHPDYFSSQRHVEMYEEFLAFLAAQQGCWRALPREVASWWRDRARMRCVRTPGGVEVREDPSGEAEVVWAKADGERVAFEM